MKITRTKADLMAELIETKRQLAGANSNLAGTKNVLSDVIDERNQLRAQVRNLTAEKGLWESRFSNSGRAVGELRRQRSEVLQALARVLADLAATPEAFNAPRPPRPEKDEAPF